MAYPSLKELTVASMNMAVRLPVPSSRQARFGVEDSIEQMCSSRE